MSSPKTNHLAGQTSPYLLQHVHNPVDWYPWGPAALAEARNTDRPILLSIGYAACHWCHVMERESFVDPHTAHLMNSHYVCIKVDREERPDLDTIYMAATQAMNQGRGGWPMTVFLTPAQKPFFAGTYFPPQDHHGMPSFGRVLTHLAHLWQHDRGQLMQQASTLTEALKPKAAAAPAHSVDSPAWMQQAVQRLTEDFDVAFGGFGPAPKFPHTTSLRLLLAHSHWSQDPTALQLVQQTLAGMAAGGMHDVIGGGFSRYSVDERWHVPHFEKMLYDNALLAEVYAEACAKTGEQQWARVTGDTLDFVLRELTADDGAFYAALDADSEGVEGKFYVWTQHSVAEALCGMAPEAIAAVCRYLDISEAGNWEDGVSIPRPIENVRRAAADMHTTPDAFAAVWQQARRRMYDARAKRIWPSRDGKILTAWNGLMLSGLAAGARVLQSARYLAAAERAAEFLWTTMRRADNKLWRTYGAGKASLNAYLEDYAYLAEGLVNLYEAGGQLRWLKWAESLGEMLLTEFCEPVSGLFLDTAHDHEALLWRSREGHDGATPNAHATAAHVLTRLAVHTQREAFETAARRAVAAYAQAMAQSPQAFAKLVLAAEVLRRGAVAYVVVLPEAHAACSTTATHLVPAQAALWAAVQGRFDPRGVVCHGAVQQAAEADALPLLRHKTCVAGEMTVYVCFDHTCSAPITSLAQWQAHLQNMPA